MMQDGKKRAIFFFSIAAAAMLLLAAGVAGILYVPTTFVQKTDEIPFWLKLLERMQGAEKWMIYIFIFLFAVALLSIVLSADGRKRFVVFLALLLLVMGSIYLLPQKKIVIEPTPTPLATITLQPAPTSELEVVEVKRVEEQPPPIYEWLVTAIGILLALVVVGVAGLLLLLLAKPRPGRSLPEAISQAAQAALDELDAGGDFGQVIIRCYARMSQVLQQERGLEREKAMTPAEFERMLARLGFPAKPLAVLTRLFERVRYGASGSDEAEVQQAVESLGAIVAFCQEGGTRA